MIIIENTFLAISNMKRK